MSVPNSPAGDNPGPADPLLPKHRADLHKSGLSDEQIALCGFYSVADRDKVNEILGGWMSTKTAAGLGPCLAIPFFGQDGKPLDYVRLRPDKRRIIAGKSVKYESPAGKPNRAYFPPATRAVLLDPGIPLLITEGEKKAAKADQEGFPCIGLVGVFGWVAKRPVGPDGKKVGPLKLIADLAAVKWAGRRVTLVFDSDLAQKPEVRLAEWHLAEVLQAAGADVRVARLPDEPNGDKNGLDDYLHRHGSEALRQRIEAAVVPEPPATGDTTLIRIGTDEHRVNAEAAEALAAEPDLYQRGGILVQVANAPTHPDPAAAVRRPAGLPVVRDLSPPILRERMTRCARWVKVTPSDDGADEQPAHPPVWCVHAVHARGEWPAIRWLEAVVTHPVLLQDGSILNATGYDQRSGLLVCTPPNLTVLVPPAPTKSDVAAAVAELLDVVSDFPFECLEHRAAWVAGLLTPLAWFAFEGPAPFFLIDKNVRGAGAGLLADVIALTLTGRRFPVMTYTADREELRKKITSLAVEGERLVLLDNLSGTVGCDVLDAALTSDRWKDRLLGGNRVYDGPLHVCWFGTGNNVQLHADTARRVCHIRMESQDECPELRTGFKYPDLRLHVRAHRGRLLSAALTILRAWFVAGKPTHGLPPWGSFEGWSGVVREAVVFAGLPDPGETRLSLQTATDRDGCAMECLLAALELMDPGRRGVTTADIIDQLKNPPNPTPEWHANLRAAVEDLCGKLDGRALGGRFRHFQRRNFGGRMLDKSGHDRTNANRWVVVPVTWKPDRAETHPASPATPASSPSDAGHAGDAGEFPAQSESGSTTDSKEPGSPSEEPNPNSQPPPVEVFEEGEL